MKKPLTNEEKGVTRLAKRMSQLGLCSRREADDLIVQGLVKVNGKIITQKGYKVTEADKITLTETAQKIQDDKVTIILNKPVGFVSGQAEKNYQSAEVLITKENHWKEDKSPIQFQKKHSWHLGIAGRLDIDSNGLLILTQNGAIAKQIIGNDNKMEKEYLVRVTGKLIPNGLALLNHGLSLDGEKLKPAKVIWQNDDQLNFILKQGKKRQIRRMCEFVGLQVTGLKRVRIGNIKLANLPKGKWRYLGEDEVF